MKILRPMVLACALLLAACATTKFQAPHLTIVGASMTSSDVFSQMFRLRVHVDNPNSTSLPVKMIDYKLFLEGDSFSEGQSTAPFVVPANGMQEFDLAVHTNFMSSIGRLLSHLAGTDRRQIEYAFSGSVVIDAPFSPRLKFEQGGLVDLTRH